MKRPPLNPEKHYFSQEQADRAIAFFESLKLPTGRWMGAPWVLMGWQRSLLTDLYGWRRRDNHLRSFNTLFLFIPRKASKSTTAAGIALYQLVIEPQLIGDLSPQIPFAGASRDQAKQLFGICKRIISKTPWLDDILTVYSGSGQAIYPDIEGVLKTVSSDGGTSMGGDLSCSLIDELHTIGIGRGSTGRGAELYDALTSASGARLSPLMVMMTTAGRSLEDETLWGREYRYAKAVEGGDIEDDSYLPIIYEADKEDDEFDPQTWKKANPSLGIAVGMDYYEEKAKKAKNDPSYLNQFKRLYLNVPANTFESWIPADVWKKCSGPALPIDGSRRCWAGLDLASVHDLCSLVLVWEPDRQGRIDMRHWNFLPEEGRREKELKDMIPYEQLSKEGIVSFTSGSVTDYAFIKAKIVEVWKMYNLQLMSIDRYNSSHLMTELEQLGMPIVGIGQGFLGMNTPVKAVERIVYNKTLRHTGDRLMKIAVSNAVVLEDPAGNRKLDKSRSVTRIDPAVGFCLAMSGLEAELPQGGAFFGNDSLFGKDSLTSD